jgi:hypothetical protein
MKLTPRRKYLLAGAVGIYLIGLSFELVQNHHFIPEPELVEQKLEQLCRKRNLSRSDFSPMGDPIITRRIFTSSDWHGTFRNSANTIEIELILEHDGDTYSKVTNLLTGEDF